MWEGGYTQYLGCHTHQETSLLQIKIKSHQENPQTLRRKIRQSNEVFFLLLIFKLLIFFCICKYKSLKLYLRTFFSLCIYFFSIYLPMLLKCDMPSIIKCYLLYSKFFIVHSRMPLSTLFFTNKTVGVLVNFSIFFS